METNRSATKILKHILQKLDDLPLEFKEQHQTTLIHVYSQISELCDCLELPIPPSKAHKKEAKLEKESEISSPSPTLIKSSLKSREERPDTAQLLNHLKNELLEDLKDSKNKLFSGKRSID